MHYLVVFLLFLAVTVSPISARNEASFRSPRPSPSPRSSAALNPKSCEARESSIKTRMSNLDRMANKMLEKFDSIASRVKTYYLASGKTVSNYDALVASVATKRSAVDTALAAARADVDTFNCDVQNPRSHMTKYLEHMKTVKAALKDYRTAIKNLIVAVRSVTGHNL